MSHVFKWTPCLAVTAAAIFTAAIPITAQSKIYVSIEQAQQLMFQGAKLTHAPIILNEQTRKIMREQSSVNHPFDSSRIWKTEQGEWFIVDEVVGKHEMITYALGINAEGAIKQIEILEYRESYGYQVSETAWRDQFIGKTSASAIKLNQDIKNISGATLSAKHLTDGIKRLLVMYQIALKNSQ